jgi:hypothetical protein
LAHRRKRAEERPLVEQALAAGHDVRRRYDMDPYSRCSASGGSTTSSSRWSWDKGPLRDVLAKNMRRLRAERGLSQKALAAQIVAICTSKSPSGSSVIPPTRVLSSNAPGGASANHMGITLLSPNLLLN